MATKMNREAWLTRMARLMENELFKGYNLRPYKITCGWPCQRGLSRRQRVVGECHSHVSSAAGNHEIFISPVLADSAEVAGTLCHEMAHIAAGIPAGHKGEFVKVCKKVGLTKGKPTTAMPGEKLEKVIQGYMSQLKVAYPHDALIPIAKTIIKPKKDTTLICPDCNCRVRISFKWLDAAGMPVCGCGKPFEEG